MAVVASSSASGRCPAGCSVGIGIARVWSAGGFDGGGGIVPRGSAGRSFGWGPRNSLSQDSISRSSPRGGWGGGGVPGVGGRPGAGGGGEDGWGEEGRGRGPFGA